ncbi:MAG: DUF1844 domain-containing protein [Desulfobacterales bacterium]|nr:DUF1844 domain-containing protein [Desulfobacterales bacterium]
MTEEKKDQTPPTGDAGAPSDERSADTDATQLPPIDFSTFVISLNSSALVQLGILEEPGTGQKTKNLALAKQTIDILAMLEEKTKGNLNRDEENILKSLLYDLRMLYVKEKG